MSDVRYEIEQGSLSQKVYAYIKALILSGKLEGGGRVPEAKIASRFGLSRTPIREALRRLEVYGLVRIKPRSYAEVVKLHPDEAEDVALLRASLEVLAIKLLTSRGTEEDFQYLEELARECEQYLENDDIAKTFEKDSEFHLEIAKRSRNVHLYELFEKLDAKVQLLRLVLSLPHDQLHRFVFQHKEIIAAMRSHDEAKSEQLMRRHILDQLEIYIPNPQR